MRFYSPLAAACVDCEVLNQVTPNDLRWRWRVYGIILLAFMETRSRGARICIFTPRC